MDTFRRLPWYDCSLKIGVPQMPHLTLLPYFSRTTSKHANNAIKPPLLSPQSIFRTKLFPVVSDVRVIWRLFQPSLRILWPRPPFCIVSHHAVRTRIAPNLMAVAQCTKASSNLDIVPMSPMITIISSSSVNSVGF